MPDPLSRIRLNESCPWPERVGQLGRIATVPDDQRDIYPLDCVDLIEETTDAS